MLIAASKRDITGIDMYKIGSDWHRAYTDFYNSFGISIKIFYDGFATMIFKRVQIDPFKFDEFLHKKYGEYEKENKSMGDIIVEKYGKYALKVFEMLLPPEPDFITCYG